MKPLTDNDAAAVTAWIASTWTHRVARHRRAAVVCSLMLCGLRAQEVADIQPIDLDDDSVLSVRTAKGGVPRRLRLTIAHAAAVRASFDLFIHRNAATQANVARRTLRSLLGTDRYSGHSLRHTAALRCYAATRDLYAVQGLLGHKSPLSTVNYLRRILEVPLDVGPCWSIVNTPTMRDAPASPIAAVAAITSAPRPTHRPDARLIRTAAKAAVREYLKQRTSTQTAFAAIIEQHPLDGQTRIALHDQLDAALIRTLETRGVRTVRAVAAALNVSVFTATELRKRFAKQRRFHTRPKGTSDAQPV